MQLGVGDFSPLRVGAPPQVPGAQISGVGCLRAPAAKSGSEGQLAQKKGVGYREGERVKEREPKGYVVN